MGDSAEKQKRPSFFKGAKLNLRKFHGRTDNQH